MSVERSGDTATLLPDGRVLIAGGWDKTNNTFLSSAELYDPETGRFSPTGPMATRHSFGTATLLSDGRVLIVGGQPDGTAELYDPKTGTFSTTGSSIDFDLGSAATLLRDGRVLVTGGGVNCVSSGCTPITSAELYDPATGKFTSTGSMAAARHSHTATLLTDGRVMVAGGVAGDCTADAGCTSIASAELYDPATGKFTATGSMALARYSHAATLLPDGQVFIAGGNGPLSDMTAELYDPSSGTFVWAGSMRSYHTTPTATLLRDGRVLVAGSGITAELYSRSNGPFAEIESAVTSRYQGTATLLTDGRVLLAGGQGLASAELYEP